MSALKWKSYPDYKSSKNPVGALPTSWDEIRFRMLFKTQKGKMPSEIHSEPLPDSIPYVSMEYLREGIGGQHVILEQGSVIIEDDDLMILWDGANAGEVLKSKYGILSSTAAKISPKNDECRDFDFFSLKSMESIIKSGNIGMGIPHVGGDFLKELILSRPSLNERRKIATYLNHRTEAINLAITRLHQKLFILEENRSALITQAVTKGLDPDVLMKDTGLNWYPEVPAHWALRRVKHIATISPSNVDKKKYDGQKKVRLANYVDVYKNDRITEELDFMVATASENEITKFSLLAGDMIITKDSETWNDIAVPAFVPKTMKAVVCGYHLTLIRPNQAHVLGEFLFRTYQALGIRDQYHYNANGVTRYGLGSYWVNNGVVPVPPIDEQHEIAEYIDKQLAIMESMSNNIKSNIEKLNEYRTTIISAAVTGKIDVRGYNNER
jgi:type I restriction enzyme, S subunit